VRGDEARGILALQDPVNPADIAAKRAGGVELRPGDGEERDEGALRITVSAVGLGLHRHRLEVDETCDLGIGGELG
jgi:hypothetical protein